MNGLICVSHFVGLSGVGGVQRNFVEFLHHEITSGSPIRHTVYTLGAIDAHYQLPVDVRDIRRPGNLLALARDLFSSKRVVHFYNNLTSPKVALFLLLLPVSKLIMHERGTVWNYPQKRGGVVRLVAWKAELILANSRATRTMLEEKFSVPSAKIRVVHNGIDLLMESPRTRGGKGRENPFRVGFIGRFDTPKGIHVLIDAMRLLTDRPITLQLAGDGVLRGYLEDRARGLDKVEFVGRVESPYAFLSRLDLLVVPSIREPFGNVCIEAGLCRVPVLAARVDGIPEIIEHRFSGELIDPTRPVELPCLQGAVPLPEWVVSARHQTLQRPMQLDPQLLAETIARLSGEPQRLTDYAGRLHARVTTVFNLSRYANELHRAYGDVAA